MEVINNLIYLNNNGSTAMDERVAEAMQQAAGSDPEEALSNAAATIAGVIGSRPSEVFFTTGVSASIHQAIAFLFETYSHKGKHCITSVIEHQATLEALEQLKQKGASVTYLPVNREGLIDPEALEDAITPDTIFVSIMAANNHTGVVQPIEKIAAICQKHNVIFFTDASQLVGKLRCDVTELGMEAMVFGSRKMYGPKGISAFYIKEGTAFHDTVSAWSKHNGVTDAALLAGFAKAAQIFEADHWENSAHISKLKNYLEHQLLDIEGLQINGSTRHRLYNTSNLTFPATKKIGSLNHRFTFLNYAETDAYVLKAMGLSDVEIKNSFRFSFGKYNTLEEVKLLVEEIMAL